MFLFCNLDRYVYVPEQIVSIYLYTLYIGKYIIINMYKDNRWLSIICKAFYGFEFKLEI